MHPQPNEKTRTLPPGISARHSRTCATSRDQSAVCTCEPAYQAWVFDRRAEVRDANGKLKRRGAKVRKTFTGKGALTEAKKWRVKATAKVEEGHQIARSRVTLRQVADQWLEGAEAEPPTVLTRGGRKFKP